MGCRWTDSFKPGHMGLKVLQFRLVAEGNQEDSDSVNTHAPSVLTEIIMLMSN